MNIKMTNAVSFLFNICRFIQLYIFQMGVKCISFFSLWCFAYNNPLIIQTPRYIFKQFLSL